MAKVIKKFRKNADYDDYGVRKSYDREFQAKKHESKQKSKQNRPGKGFLDLSDDDYSDSARNRRY